MTKNRKERKGNKREVNPHNIIFSPEERDQIIEQRKFNDIPEGSWTWKIAVWNDSVRAGIRETKLVIEKLFVDIENMVNHTVRMSSQLKSGKITEKLPDGEDVMTPEELTQQLHHTKYMCLGHIYSVPAKLAELRKWVGRKTVDRKIAMLEEDFDGYVEECRERTHRLGFNFLG